MKFLKCIVLFVLLIAIVSCSNTYKSNSEKYRKEEITNRKAIPKTVMETVNDVRFTVKFDRSEYYLGDDIEFYVTAENIGKDSITWETYSSLEIQHTIYTQLYVNGASVVSDYLFMNTPLDRVENAIQEITWEPGIMIANEGRIPTSIFFDALDSNAEIMLRVGTGESTYIEIPVSIHSVNWQDCDFLYYLENGYISKPLYYRICTMSFEETIPVIFNDTWKDDILDFSKEIISNQYGQNAVWLSRVELLELLNRRIMANTNDSNSLQYIYEGKYRPVELFRFYPVKEELS